MGEREEEKHGINTLPNTQIRLHNDLKVKGMHYISIPDSPHGEHRISTQIQREYRKQILI
jgi:hypothetical protein